ncbi:MAG: hypothetical protein SWJ54_07555, partial [Cyanobacteriota bacterium]|nr:hypothetical protein [Cyanobacteriota bacterium]
MLTRLNHLWLQVSSATLCTIVGTLICTYSANAIRSPHKPSTSHSWLPTQTQKFHLLSTEKIATDDSLAQKFVNHYLKGEPVAGLSTDLTLEQALSVQKEFVQLLTSHLGPVVGYKAGLTNPIAQQRLNVSQPVRGVLLKQMLLDNGAVVPANFGARPQFEADLMVRVGDESINEAKTPQEVLDALDAVIPFLELPDLVFLPDFKPNAAAIVAINVGARLGVLGTPIPLAATPEWEQRLGKVQVSLLNEDGEEIAKGDSTALLGHPLKAVIWLGFDAGRKLAHPARLLPVSGVPDRTEQGGGADHHRRVAQRH